MLNVPSLVEIGPLVVENKTFKCHHCILIISLLFLLENGCGSLFERRVAFCKWFSGSGKRIEDVESLDRHTARKYS
jgi:hypothetical protein